MGYDWYKKCFNIFQRCLVLQNVFTYKKYYYFYGTFDKLLNVYKNS